MRPVNHLNTASKLYPNAWEQVDIFRADRGRGLPDWPQWCFLPMAAWYAIVSEGGQMPLNRVPDVGRLAALGTWRYSQGIYRFDPDIFSALYDTVPMGEIPVDVLFRLPEWSVYIETHGTRFAGDKLHGFFVHLEFDVITQRPELRLLLDTEQQLMPIPLHIGKWTVTEAVDRALSETGKQAVKALGVTLPPAPSDQLAEELYGLVSLVLYICSDEPEIDDEREPEATPQRPHPKRTKKGWRLFPASRPRIWKVAEALGEKLRQQTASDPSGRKVAPHLRRAHWHGFWSGPRDGERRYGYKFLPPMLVNPAEGDDNDK